MLVLVHVSYIVNYFYDGSIVKHTSFRLYLLSISSIWVTCDIKWMKVLLS